MANLTRDPRNVVIRATCQMLFGAGRSLIGATAPLIAYTIAAEKALATLPHALVIVGTALVTLPAALLMRRIGRRYGFLFGALIGAVGGAVCVVAVASSDFWLFCLGTLLFGISAGFSQHFRFAAADVAPLDFRSTAISLVLAGGVFAAFLGPELAKAGKDLVGSTEFVGAYVFLIALTLLTGLVVMLLDIPNLTPTEAAAPGRPISAILRQPVVIVAVLAAVITQGVMNLLMTGTPIAMTVAHHGFSDIALVIEWHTVCMFAPGFFTGSLIRRWGEIRIILAGLALTALSVGIALGGQTVLAFWTSMAVLGLGWNFAFTAGTSLLNDAHDPSERAKTQGVVNFMVYGFAAVMALSSGSLLHFLGWNWLNIFALPLIAVAVVVTLRYAGRR